MRVLNAILLAAVLVVLGVVAYDLHRVANVMTAVTGVGAPTVKMTREQRRAMLQQQGKEMDEYLDDFFSTPPSKSQTPQKPR